MQACTFNINHDYRELTPHGSFTFPCAAYSSLYTTELQNELPWHWHKEIELIHVASGNLQVQIPNKTFCLHEGESLFFNSNILHYGFTQNQCKLYSLVFHPSLITGSESSIFAQRYIDPLTHSETLGAYVFKTDSTVDQVALTSIIQAFEAMANKPTGYEFIVREKLSQVCLFLYEKYEIGKGRPHLEPSIDSLRIKKMLDFIHAHYSESLDLCQIAQVANIGEREALRCFKRTIQTSPMQYLIKYRITQGATLLLKDKTAHIAHISTQCGFDSPSHFSEAFKRFFNCTPREYKKNNL